MVQSRPWLWLRQAPRRGRRRGCVRPHGDCAQRTPSRAPAGPAAAGASRAERQGPDRGRAQGARRLGGIAAALAAALVACSPPAPAANVPAEEQAQTGLAQVSLTIRSANGEHHLIVEVAATPQQ